eukprot:1508355-Pleurochrysis_carterae.AAC.3
MKAPQGGQFNEAKVTKRTATSFVSKAPHDSALRLPPSPVSKLEFASFLLPHAPPSLPSMFPASFLSTFALIEAASTSSKLKPFGIETVVSSDAVQS